MIQAFGGAEVPYSTSTDPVLRTWLWQGCSAGPPTPTRPLHLANRRGRGCEVSRVWACRYFHGTGKETDQRGGLVALGRGPGQFSPRGLDTLDSHHQPWECDEMIVTWRSGVSENRTRQT